MTNDDYAPITDQVRCAYQRDMVKLAGWESAGSGFDRWLAAHDADLTARYKLDGAWESAALYLRERDEARGRLAAVVASVDLPGGSEVVKKLYPAGSQTAPHYAAGYNAAKEALVALIAKATDGPE